MTEAEVMRGYRWALREVSMVQQQIETVERMLGPAGTKAMAGWETLRGTNNVEAALLQRMECLLRRLAEKQEALVCWMGWFDQVLDAVADPLTRQVLHLYFGFGLTDEKVAERLCYSIRTVNRVRNVWLRHGGGREFTGVVERGAAPDPARGAAPGPREGVFDPFRNPAPGGERYSVGMNVPLGKMGAGEKGSAA